MEVEKTKEDIPELMINRTELLAPAKDLECGIAAINCGADAVYIGAPRFGAREAAGNSLEDIAELVRYAHKFWARVYVTLNTILTDYELPHALELINQLHEIGIDGLIIQDTGLLECDLPPIPLIASTQMNNASPEKVEFLGKVGFKRAILARELDLDQIKAIRNCTDIELECFIHGALCVGYSGQCYLSYSFGRRSGNRGQCAQPCRRLYSLVDSSGKVLVKDKHLLSIRDLNLSDHLRELIEAGVCSFKIEGRLKDKAYVSNVVAIYRAKLDQILSEMDLKKSSSGVSIANFVPDVNKTFNRGYSTYFLHGKGEPIGSTDTPKMVGERIGIVASVGNKSFRLNSEVQLHSGDGICFFDADGKLNGTVVNAIYGDRIVSEKVEILYSGAVIYRNNDHEFRSQLKKASPERVISIKLSLEETNDGFSLIAEDEDQNVAEFKLQCDKILAEKPESAIENIKRQLSKTGGTEYRCDSVAIESNQAYFLPISVLNSLRRGALDKLAEVREQNRPKQSGGALVNDFPYPEKCLSYMGNVFNSKAEAFYRRHGVSSIEPAAEAGHDMCGKQVMTTRYCIKHQLGMCVNGKPSIKLAEPLYLIDESGKKLKLAFDCSSCKMKVYQTY